MVEALSKGTTYRITNSMALQVVFSYNTNKEICRMQQISKRFYKTFCPALIREMKLYEIGNMASGVIVFPNEEDSYFELDICRKESWTKRALKQEGTVFQTDQDDLYGDAPTVGGRMMQYLRNSMYRSPSQAKIETGAIKPAVTWPMWPKIVQVNYSDVYIVGGNDTTPSSQFDVR
jgi:hypothetical protein